MVHGFIEGNLWIYCVQCVLCAHFTIISFYLIRKPFHFLVEFFLFFLPNSELKGWNIFAMSVFSCINFFLRFLCFCFTCFTLFNKTIYLFIFVVHLFPPRSHRTSNLVPTSRPGIRTKFRRKKKIIQKCRMPKGINNNHFWCETSTLHSLVWLNTYQKSNCPVTSKIAGEKISLRKNSTYSHFLFRRQRRDGQKRFNIVYIWHCFAIFYSILHLRFFFNFGSRLRNQSSGIL